MVAGLAKVMGCENRSTFRNIDHGPEIRGAKEVVSKEAFAQESIDALTNSESGKARELNLMSAYGNAVNEG
jgi:hypothetical protein